jgi:hypothetical protein
MRADLGAFRPWAVGLAVLMMLGCGRSPGGASPGATVSGRPGPAQTGTATPASPLPVPSVAAGGAPGSTVVGYYRERATEQAAPHGVAGVTIGLFPHAFQLGPNALDGSEAGGGRPVATSRTGADGRFALNRVPDGVWFLSRTDGAAVTVGRWVRVTKAEGASADLLGCRACPPPA